MNINNEKIIKMQLNRREVIEMLIALNCVCEVMPNGTKWKALHNKINSILNDSDMGGEEE